MGIDLGPVKSKDYAKIQKILDIAEEYHRTEEYDLEFKILDILLEEIQKYRNGKTL